MMSLLSIAAEIEYKLVKDPLLFNYIFVLVITVHNRPSCSYISLPKWSFGREYFFGTIFVNLLLFFCITPLHAERGGTASALPFLTTYRDYG
jgi:hypothetical protein